MVEKRPEKSVGKEVVEGKDEAHAGDDLGDGGKEAFVEGEGAFGVSYGGERAKEAAGVDLVEMVSKWV